MRNWKLKLMVMGIVMAGLWSSANSQTAITQYGMPVMPPYSVLSYATSTLGNYQVATTWVASPKVYHLTSWCAINTTATVGYIEFYAASSTYSNMTSAMRRHIVLPASMTAPIEITYTSPIQFSPGLVVKTSGAFDCDVGGFN